MAVLSLPVGLIIVTLAIVFGFVLPRLRLNPLNDDRRQRCGQNLRSIAAAAEAYKLALGRLPAEISELQNFGLTAAQTNCPAAPLDYAFDASSAALLICPNHRSAGDGTPFGVSSNFVVFAERYGSGPRLELTKSQISALAEAELRRRGWASLEIASVTREASNWKVQVRRIPTIPDGHAGVLVSKSGQIVRYCPGK